MDRLKEHLYTRNVVSRAKFTGQTLPEYPFCLQPILGMFPEISASFIPKIIPQIMGALHEPTPGLQAQSLKAPSHLLRSFLQDRLRPIMGIIHSLIFHYKPSS